jgi:hypothetical protein
MIIIDKAVRPDGVLVVKEQAPYGKQLGLQAVMQFVVKMYPASELSVHVLFCDYKGKPLKRVYRIREGLYAPVGRQTTNWRDYTGSKVTV